VRIDANASAIAVAAEEIEWSSTQETGWVRTQEILHESDRCKTDNGDDEDDYWRSHGVNPATGYPMINSSIDVGSHAYGCGPDNSDDGHWHRRFLSMWLDSI
jgi:hypothetical protein